MTVRALLLSTLLATLSALAQTDTVFVLTRLHPEVVIGRNQQHVLDLRDVFQTFAAPGPVATFTYAKPVADGKRQLYANYAYGTDMLPLFDEQNRIVPENSGQLYNMYTYATQSGTPYLNLYAAYPEDFVWEDFTVRFQLFPVDAPQTVANFMTYAGEGEYNRTIVHRNPNPDQPSLIQAGGFRHYAGNDAGFILEYIPVLPPITLEAVRSNVAGTLAMARENAPNSATAQFYINLTNNQGMLDRFDDFYYPGYAVFGEIIEGSLDDLITLARTPTYNLASVFGTDVFATTPLFTPFWDEPQSYVTFQSISVSAGDPAGVTYGVEIVDRSSLEIEDDPDSFTWSIDEDGQMTIKAVDTGTLVINVTGTDPQQRSRSFQAALTAANLSILEAFPDPLDVYSGNRYTSAWFGSFTEGAKQFPWILHDEHGELYLYGALPSQPVNFTYLNPANSLQVPILTGRQFLIKDPVLDWLLTSSGRYPWVYSFRHNRWFRYLTKQGTVEGRWFYEAMAARWFFFPGIEGTDEGRWVFDPREAAGESQGWFIDRVLFPAP
jgi:cyclophilin family peptidyl-prolyl cis-trans isomerase